MISLLHVCTHFGYAWGGPWAEHRSIFYPHWYPLHSKGPPNNAPRGQPLRTRVQTPLWYLRPEGRWKLPFLCWPRSERAKGFNPEGESWLLSGNPAPQHTQSQKDNCPKGQPQRRKKFFYLFSFKFSLPAKTSAAAVAGPRGACHLTRQGRP